MPLYNYTAKDEKGIKKNGTVDARDKNTAVELLKSQNLFVVSLEEKKESLLLELIKFRGVPSSEVVAFTRQFSTMISAGLPISKALDVLTEQTQNANLKRILYDILKSVEGGLSLSEALGRYSDVFSPTYQALVRAGESSGKLDEILNRLAIKMEEQREISARFRGAMIYPAIVFIAMIGVFILLMVFVIPKLADMYRNMNVELPKITQVMIVVSDFMAKNLLWFPVVAVVAGLFIRYFLKTEQGREIVSEVTFKLPIFGKIAKLKELSQFTSTLSLLLASAVPIVESLGIVSTVAGSPSFKRAAKEAASQVEKGNELADYFKSNQIFPPLVSQMAGVGQETGKMDEVLQKVAVYFDGELNHLIQGLSAALEPIILIILGTMVGFLIVSIITPIYKITSSI